MKILSACALLALLISGCATDPAALGVIAQARLEAAKTPTLVVDCPSGCNVRYTDPRDKAIDMRLPTNGWDAAVAVSGQVTGLVAGAVPYAAIAGVAVRGLERAGGNDSSTVNNQIGPNSQNQATTTTSTDRHDSAITDSHDATATPTVVTQPAPVIVTQPAPLVVNPFVVTP